MFLNIHCTDLRLLKSELGSEKKLGFSFKKLKKIEKLKWHDVFKILEVLKNLCQAILRERETVHTYQTSGNGFPGNRRRKNLKMMKGLEVQASVFVKMPTSLEKRFLRPEDRGQSREPLYTLRSIMCFEGPKERASHPSDVL